MTIAYQSDGSGFVSLLGYGIIVYSFLSDVLIFDEDLVFLQLVGALVIFTATFFVAVFKLCEQHRARKRAESFNKVQAGDGEAKLDAKTELALSR
mmetsp:Transcript_31339/g.38831  ORF Transcript_31339/g.38831 Transcript_31339/m.38831 type:complete len:95 (+) Transcript_31339:1120-1404(+)